MTVGELTGLELQYVIVGKTCLGSIFSLQPISVYPWK